jgi:hypothetical protein
VLHERGLVSPRQWHRSASQWDAWALHDTAEALHGVGNVSQVNASQEHGVAISPAMTPKRDDTEHD